MRSVEEYISEIKKIFKAKNINRLLKPPKKFENNIIEIISESNNRKWINDCLEKNRTVVSFTCHLLKDGKKIKPNTDFLYIDFGIKDIIDFVENNKENVLLSEFLYYLIALFIHQETLYVVGERHTNDFIKGKDEFVAKTIYYRGQSDSKWRLIPSFFRNLNKKVLVNKNYLLKKYGDLGLIDKYLNHIDKKMNYNAVYNVISFMQHACSYSPFLDFSKSKDVAKSFAINKSGNINDYNNNDSIIYLLKVFNEEGNVLKSDEEIEEFINNKYKVYYLNVDNIFDILGRPVEYVYIDHDGVERKDYLNIHSISEMIKLLTPKFIIIDKQSNDRMKYQKGVFVVFYDCICIKGEFLYELSRGFRLGHDLIKKVEKEKELNELFKNSRQYTMDYLMDPYKIFRE